MAEEIKTPIEETVPIESETTSEPVKLEEEVTAVQEAEDAAPTPAPTRRRRRTVKTDDIKTIPAEENNEEQNTTEEEPKPAKEATPTPSHLPVIMIDKGTRYEDDDERETAWHSVKNAFLTRKILNGVLSGVETTPNDRAIIAVTYYEDYKVIIPAQEMIETAPNEHLDNVAYSKILSSMVGAEISFVILSIENESKTIVASRNRANARNRKTFYFDKDAYGRYKIYEGSLVEARVVGINRNSVTLEIFGATVSVPAAELSWTWISDINELYSIGDRVMVKITEINGRDKDETDSFYITASVRQAQENEQAELISRTRKGNVFVGKVIDIRKGTYIIKLTNGLQAISHNSRSVKKVMKGDTVAYVVGFVDKQTMTVNGMITRIIKQGR